MIYTQNDLLKLILDTNAVSIWNNKTGPVFWYAANVPGPFYVNTELVIGQKRAEQLLRDITAIVAGTKDVEVRADQLDRLVLESFNKCPEWQRLIATMVDRAHREISEDQYNLISGGERRDWLFSIPFAHVVNRPHLYLFKNETIYCEKPVKAGQNVLHVSDLINNAASFFDLWQPALEKSKLHCAGNVCVNVRGDNGMQRLKDVGQKVVSLNRIDVDFFRRLHSANLVSRQTFEEISVFFLSGPDWASKYLIDRPELFNVKECDSKSFERLRYFIEQDPWKLQPKHERFFANMRKAIEQRAA